MPWSVDNSWVEKHSDDPELLTIDPRPTLKYLQGHIPRSASLPISKLFTPTLQLRPLDQLASTLGSIGAARDRIVLVYDNYDGQSGAMLSWALEFLGHQQVLLLSSFFEAWKDEARPLLYRQVKMESRKFDPDPNYEVRATYDNVKESTGLKLLDLRSEEEFSGKQERPDTKESKALAHLPNAINLPWTRLLGHDNAVLLPATYLEKIFSAQGMTKEDTIVTYCSFGPRAAIGYLALKRAGYENVKVYDNASMQLSGEGGPFSQDNCVAASWNAE